MRFLKLFLGNKMASIPGWHVGDQGSIPYRGTIHYERLSSRVYNILGPTKCPVPPSRSSLTRPSGVGTGDQEYQNTLSLTPTITKILNSIFRSFANCSSTTTLENYGVL